MAKLKVINAAFHAHYTAYSFKLYLDEDGQTHAQQQRQNKVNFASLRTISTKAVRFIVLKPVAV